MSADPEPRLRELSVREATQIARQFYEAKKADYEVDLFESWHENGCRIVLCEYVEDRHGADPELQADFDDMYGDLVDAYIAMHEIALTGPARRLLDRSVAAALLQALNEIFDRMRGDFSDEKRVSRFPHGNFNDRPAESIPLSIIGSFGKYACLKELAPSTVKRWGAVMGNLVHHVGHDDARRLDHRELAAWRDHLLKARQAITVRDVYVAALRTTLEWLVDEQELSTNAAAKVKVPVPNKDELRSKSLSDTEVARILAASLLPHGNLGPVHANARRWVPWICAYTGARVNEITQMRRQDVRLIDGIWSFRITPEAGTVKNRKARVIPVHPHLVEQGLLDFVSRQGPYEMFYNARAKEDGKDPVPTYKKTGERLAEWVRDDLGITDRGIGPNHGWRHRFKTVGR